MEPFGVLSETSLEGELFPAELALEGSLSPVNKQVSFKVGASKEALLTFGTLVGSIIGV